MGLKYMVCCFAILAFMTLVESGEWFYNSNGDAANANDMWAVAFYKTPQKWFTGDILDSGLIQDVRGPDICRDKCIKTKGCQSYNLGNTNPGEFYCQLTSYHYLDAGKTVEEKSNEDEVNWSLMHKRTDG